VIEQSNTSVDGKSKNVTWRQKITVRAARDGSVNTRTNVGRTDMMSINDDLFKTFNSETVKVILRTYNQFQVELTKVNTSSVSYNEKEVYEAEFELKYYTRIEVSS
jgi:arginyl-tRNA synthetase